MTIELSENVINAIADAVVEKMQEPKTGRWIDIGNEGLVFKCSLCGTKKTIESHYCPNCGARMTESEGNA